MKNVVPWEKVNLIAAILLSFLPYLYYIIITDLSLTTRLAKTAAYVGFLTLWWAYVLGIRRFIGIFIKDMAWVLSLHKWFNILGFLLVLGHPILLHLNGLRLGVWIPSFASDWRSRVTMGVIALIVWGLIWFTSALIKGKLTFRVWKRIHLLAYPILFMGFYHIQIGSFVEDYVVINYFNWLLFIVFVLLIVWQLSGRLGIGIAKYKVIQVSKPAQQTISLLITHVSGQTIKPTPGQYIYLQLKPGGESHPFSISDYDPKSEQIEVTIKNLGKFSAMLQEIKQSTELIVDGPYGVFLRDFDEYDGDIVFIAGGIGMTPFVSVMRNLERTGYDPTQKLYLFHGSRTLKDAAFDEEIERLEQKMTDVDIVTVLDHDPEFEGEKGFITPELIRKYVSNINNAHFFLCGPPIMIKILTKQLNEAGVNKKNISAENFSS